MTAAAAAAQMFQSYDLFDIFIATFPAILKLN